MALQTPPHPPAPPVQSRGHVTRALISPSGDRSGAAGDRWLAADSDQFAAEWRRPAPSPAHRSCGSGHELACIGRPLGPEAEHTRRREAPSTPKYAACSRENIRSPSEALKPHRKAQRACRRIPDIEELKSIIQRIFKILLKFFLQGMLQGVQMPPAKFHEYKLNLKGCKVALSGATPCRSILRGGEKWQSLETIDWFSVNNKLTKFIFWR